MERGRDIFAKAVSDKQREILSRSPGMTALDAFRLATTEVVTARPDLLAAYRGEDVLLVTGRSSGGQMQAQRLEWK